MKNGEDLNCFPRWGGIVLMFFSKKTVGSQHGKRGSSTRSRCVLGPPWCTHAVNIHIGPLLKIAPSGHQKRKSQLADIRALSTVDHQRDRRQRRGVAEHHRTASQVPRRPSRGAGVARSSERVEWSHGAHGATERRVERGGVTATRRMQQPSKNDSDEL